MRVLCHLPPHNFTVSWLRKSSCTRGCRRSALSEKSIERSSEAWGGSDRLVAAVREAIGCGRSKAIGCGDQLQRRSGVAVGEAIGGEG
ncbi:MAG: hypothetical protein HC865_21590 [Cyanobacteria bacterium RU_5_0]|nr:hypothetical protein [Cyanobacteria bacterium RU_5_0]